MLRTILSLEVLNTFDDEREILLTIDKWYEKSDESFLGP